MNKHYIVGTEDDFEVVITVKVIIINRGVVRRSSVVNVTDSVFINVYFVIVVKVVVNTEIGIVSMRDVAFDMVVPVVVNIVSMGGHKVVFLEIVNTFIILLMDTEKVIVFVGEKI